MVELMPRRLDNAAACAWAASCAAVASFVAVVAGLGAVGDLGISAMATPVAAAPTPAAMSGINGKIGAKVRPLFFVGIRTFSVRLQYSSLTSQRVHDTTGCSSRHDFLC